MHDPDLTVLLADIHVSGREGTQTHQRSRFERVVADILAMDPLPARAVLFGDLAWNAGEREDYRRTRPLIAALEEAGIPLTIGMGNHDRRSTFLEFYPEYAQRTLVPGRIVTVCYAGSVDFLMLDGLQGDDERASNDIGPVAGALDPAQQEWLLEALPRWKKPVLVCSHYPVNELSAGGRPLKNLICSVPAVAGYIFGHLHYWQKSWLQSGWAAPIVRKRALCLPSVGHWGDIGYALLRTTPKSAVVSLVQYEHFFPTPKPVWPDDRSLWDAATAENQGQTCTFPLPRTIAPES